MSVKLHPVLLEKQKETIEEVNNQLDTFGKSLMIRPTGFGKTYTLIEGFAKPFLKEYKNKSVVYVYPLDIIKTEITAGKQKKDENGTLITEPSKYMKDGKLRLKGKNKNLYFISYQELSRKFNEDSNYWREYFNEHNIGLIILDEAHRAGSEKFYEIYDSIRDLIGPDGIRMVGATATPDRMDDSDEKLSVLEYVFDNKQPFKYGLGEALNDGIVPELVYMADRFTIDNQAQKLKKNAKQKFGDAFDEKSFNVELGRLKQETGDEPNTIMKAIDQAGYNPVKDKYYKFIVFFTNIDDMAEQAEDVEKWFEEAFNKRIKEKYQLKNKFTVRTSYVASTDREDKFAELVSKSPSTRRYFNKTKYVEELIEEELKVDLLFTVDMINMGYHVENITGIMMRRGTKSEIVYYQQLGRAISVSAEHNPIVIDCVNNIGENFWFKKDAKHRDGTTGATGVTGEKQHKEVDINPEYLGSLNMFNRFMSRYDCKDNMTDRLELEYLYLDREMPIYVIAAFKKLTCKEVVKRLLKYEIPLKKEDNEYNRLMDKCSDLAEARNKTAFMKEVYKFKFLNCKEATYNGNCPYIKNKQTSTMYDMLNKK